LSIPDRVSGTLLTVEAWYPATAQFAGQDLDRATQDRFRIDPFPVVRMPQPAVRHAEVAHLPDTPLVVFSHGLASFGRQSTFLTTHLASHGYVVLAPDHPNSSLPAVLRRAHRATRTIAHRRMSMMGRERLRNIDAVLLGFRDADREIARVVGDGPVGLTGHSFGAWTTLAYTSQHTPIGAALPMAPIGLGFNPVFEEDSAYAGVDLSYPMRPPTITLAAEYDSLCPLRGIRRLHSALPAGPRLLVLHGAEHFHFCDYVEIAHALFRGGYAVARIFGRAQERVRSRSELLGAEEAKIAAKVIALALFDANLRENAKAQQWLDGDLLRTLGTMSVRCSEIDPIDEAA